MVSLTAANYSDAIEVLNKRFGNKQQIVARYMEALLSMECSVSGGVSALCGLYDSIESHVWQLKTLGISADV